MSKQFVVVPNECTPEMEAAAKEADALFGKWPSVYRAMLDKRPDTGMVAVRRNLLEAIVAGYSEQHDAIHFGPKTQMISAGQAVAEIQEALSND